MKVMKFFKRSPDVLLIIAGLISCFVLYGCGAASLGPQEPLLPTVEGQATFLTASSWKKSPNSSMTYLVENSSKGTRSIITARRNNLIKTEN